MINVPRTIIDTATLFNKLGLVVHPEKSLLVPTQRLLFTGFILDSSLVQISLTLENADKFQYAFQQLLETAFPSSRQVA